MDIKELEVLRDAAEKRFNELQDELRRLEGEFRAYVALIAKKTEPAEPATTVTAVPKASNGK